jgi:hypothetical protein
MTVLLQKPGFVAIDLIFAAGLPVIVVAQKYLHR